jgi:hypothetical protein
MSTSAYSPKACCDEYSARRKRYARAVRLAYRACYRSRSQGSRTVDAVRRGLWRAAVHHLRWCGRKGPAASCQPGAAVRLGGTPAVGGCLGSSRGLVLAGEEQAAPGVGEEAFVSLRAPASLPD